MLTGLRVDHLSTFPHGGAGAAAASIHRSLLQLNRNAGAPVGGPNINSRYWYWKNDADLLLDSTFSPLRFVDPAIDPPHWFPPKVYYQNWQKKRAEKRRIAAVIQRYHQHLLGNDRQTEVFSQAEAVHRAEVDYGNKLPEIIHLHWTAFSLDWPSFFANLPPAVPIVWTLHDQNAFTGGCHYTSGCQRFEQACGHCPQIRNPGESDLSAHTFKLKKDIIESLVANGHDIHVVAPSRWMLEQAKKSPVFTAAASFRQIPYGIDWSALGAPSLPSVNQTMQQRLLPTVLLGAEDLSNHRKGIDLALDAVNRIFELIANANAVTPHPVSDASSTALLQVWTFGKTLPSEIVDRLHPRIAIKQWGYITDRKLLGRLYASSHIFLMPSREDNQPQTVLESLGCGTPVVGFDIGGVPEMIVPGQTGFVVPLADTCQMAQRAWQLIQMGHDRSSRRVLAERCRLSVNEKYECRRQAREYAELYQAIANRGRSFTKSIARPKTAEIAANLGANISAKKHFAMSGE